jgi:UPF0755 protein
LSRGERSRPERTSEERERDRLERERRRAQRAGASPPAPARGPVEDGTGEPIGAPAHEAASEPQAVPAEAPPASLAEAAQASPTETPPAPVLEESAGVREDASALMRQESAVVSEDAPALAREKPARVHEDAPARVQQDPPATREDASAPARERPARVPESASAPAREEPEPAAPPESSAVAPAIPEPPPTESHDTLLASHEAAGEDLGAPPPAPVEPVASEPRGLPPRLGRAHLRARRPRRRAAALGGPGAPRPRSRGRIAGSRLAALLALGAVAVVIVLLVRSLTHSGAGKPVAAPTVVKVVIPEGKTRVQIAQLAEKAGLNGSYRRATQRSPLLTPTHYGASRHTPDLEGFLFPATYDMDKGAPVSGLVEEQLTAFGENFGLAEISRAKALGVTPYQLLTVASMVEREAQVPSDRAKIAAVIYNRLKAGIPLGIDATIYYAVELEKNVATYTHELTEAQLHIDSPYNTRTHTGLPPTPISNPGAASIQAAARPARVSYLYYVAAADGCGEQVFSNTQSEFEANVAAYEAAKQKNGGHPPSCKKG